MNFNGSETIENVPLIGKFVGNMEADNMGW
jgi:hypothetical protein